MSAAAPVTSLEPRPVEPLGPIAARLRTADRRLQMERGGALFLRAWPWAVVFILAAFTLDVLLHLGPVIRLGLSAAFVLLILAGAAAGAWIASVKRDAFAHTARVLESRHPRLAN